ncbi:hypothetical protein [Cellulomonas fengjieae]|uniref:LppX_LprAFG lipoprotein n=1 Tax=Cellulomonas fengjieae TaxID=2819978 RepID=A0ABS3SKJ3_9CELL|nr:hypothetical protein [Cellulomonas fengjieae]MBO3086257.1 hypothetical protein [Cellulomonas fengjieae]QVI65697.1 hypothetical protein KG102_16670 [Cellulomonas fengjieae]
MRHRLTAIPVVIVVAAGLAACSTDNPSASPSPTATTASPTASATPTPTPTVAELSAANFVERVSAAEAAVTSYDIAVSVAGPVAMDLTGSADLAGGKRNVAMTMSDPDMGSIELRMVDSILYLNLGEASGGLFLQLDPNDAGNPLASSFAGFEDQILENGLAGMDQAVVSVTKVGAPEALDGTAVQAYEVVFDTAKIAPDAAQKLLENEGVPALPPTMTITYWLDAQDVARKTVYQLEGTTTTTHVTNLGAGAPVTAPPADQVTTEMPF